tara:strand:+ start:463 stop:600 length:138 start_codon:yes stop_codon:yes gene_type:complete
MLTDNQILSYKLKAIELSHLERIIWGIEADFSHRCPDSVADKKHA